MDTGQSTIHTRGYFGIGIYGVKYGSNVGTLWRSAHLMQAGFIFTIGRRYTPVPSDTHKSWRQVPLFEYDTFDQFRAALPKGARLVGVELTGRSIPLPEYTHPACAVYLLGAEDHGLPQEVLDACDDVVQIPSANSLNVAVAGSIVAYDRLAKAAMHAQPHDRHG